MTGESTSLHSRRYSTGDSADPDRENTRLKKTTHLQKIAHLKGYDFQLAYLAMLTLERIKPLSRWEKPLADTWTDCIEDLGLFSRTVTRGVKTGKAVTEIVFSRSRDLVDSYHGEFDNTPVDKSAAVRRREGSVFGYPSCCVEHFIAKPYDPNGLPHEDQKILFHWACPGCEHTARLLPLYRDVYLRLLDLE